MRRLLSTLLAGILAAGVTLSTVPVAEAATTITCRTGMKKVTDPSGKQRCVLALTKPSAKCPNGQPKPAGGVCKGKGKATRKCNKGFVLNPTTKQCVRTPKSPAPRCPKGAKLNATTKKCSRTPTPPGKNCPKGTVLNPTTKKCTPTRTPPSKRCPPNFKLSPTTKTCTPNRPVICRKPAVRDPATNKCVVPTA